MDLSRRNFLGIVGRGAAMGAAVSWPAGATSLAAPFEPPRTSLPNGPILLNSNENPYGPSPKVMEAMREALTLANRYLFPEYDGLKERIASLHKVKAGQVLLGCGSSEILRVAAEAFLAPGRKYVQAMPTFEVCEYCAHAAKAEIVHVPLTSTFAHDLDQMLAHCDGNTGLVYICNPNNPTGSLTPRRDIESFLSKLPADTYVLIDEAYHHYAGRSGTYASFLDHPVNDERVIVARTFSKVYGLAGMRLGYGIAAPKAIERMLPFVNDITVNTAVVRAAMAALDDTESVRVFAKRNADDRQEFFNQARARMLTPIESHANFVMMNVQQPALQVIEYFRQHNIRIGRRFPPLDTYVRISLGKPEEMSSFWRAWDGMPKPKNVMQR
jgi:histidinol-phosphate aminotransferase